MSSITLDEVIAELRGLSEPVPKPQRLPTAAELAVVESELDLTLSPEYRRFLLEASDVVLGALEPATISAPSFHTHLPKVVASARFYGVPKHLLPICEDNADFYCLTPEGEVRFWSHSGEVNESWPTLADWIAQVWIGERG